MVLTEEERQLYSDVMFAQHPNHTIDNLSPPQKQQLIQLYAQKIAFHTVNNHIQPPPSETDHEGEEETTVTCGHMLCCCCYPRESSFLFQINTSSFLKRCFSPCLLCGGLVETGDSGDELYGFCWVGLTYVIILGVAANLNEYFILPQGYKFENTLMLMSIGLSSIFQLLGVFVYGAIVKCLNSQLTFIQSAMIMGYSLVLYFLPTILCLLPSFWWHVGMLLFAALTRTIFLYNNYSGSVQQNKLVLLPVILIIEGLYSYLLLSSLFRNHNGDSIHQATQNMFKHLALRSFSS